MEGTGIWSRRQMRILRWAGCACCAIGPYQLIWRRSERQRIIHLPQNPPRLARDMPIHTFCTFRVCHGDCRYKHDWWYLNTESRPRPTVVRCAGETIQATFVFRDSPALDIRLLPTEMQLPASSPEGVCACRLQLKQSLYQMKYTDQQHVASTWIGLGDGLPYQRRWIIVFWNQVPAHNARLIHCHLLLIAAGSIRAPTESFAFKPAVLNGAPTTSRSDSAFV